MGPKVQIIFSYVVCCAGRVVLLQQLFSHVVIHFYRHGDDQAQQARRNEPVNTGCPDARLS